MWANEDNKAGEESVNLFLRSIILREYSRYLSFNHPYSHERPLLSPQVFPWVVDQNHFKAWRQGRTGYPLVDAGMRGCGLLGGCMIEYVWLCLVSLSKYCSYHGDGGMKYFWDTLLDADLESDALGWQYISGTLPDGRELDRIDNPQFEGYKFDPHGEYVRRWLPELSRLPTEWIHHPWDAPESVLQAAGVELGSNYPFPIVHLSAAKQRLQEALAENGRLKLHQEPPWKTGQKRALVILQIDLSLNFLKKRTWKRIMSLLGLMLFRQHPGGTWIRWYLA
ncbi:hypothetical protein HPP92_027684 [Vanilla planifolia]|uniref:Cryptochrome/DNA photolyase FAD-binding domain-containing protein n=1 Tax=Vanilla planifolia TaxID=51239 RepID=A0A835P8Z3_VANPL|nr:hypothetical protein HPP92_027684 [Vanilla planifolia]